jgi:ABC-type Mn2+/Zn2+ transport system ATPase subunit
VNDAQIAVSDADLGYLGQPVLRGVSLELRPGEFVAVLGPNGAGKTTLLRSLLGFLPPLAGRIERAASLRIGYVPQRETLDARYPLSGADVAMFGTYGDLPFWRRTTPRLRERGRAALAAWAASSSHSDATRSSRAGRQRILIARSRRRQLCSCSTSRRPASIASES